MQLLDIPNVYLAVAAGFVIWFMGQACGSKSFKVRPSRFGTFLSLVGALVFGVGVYAGCRGPLTIAGVSLEPFPFLKKIDQGSADALAYARTSLEISREPAIGWRGASKTALQYTVSNKGDRKIVRLVLRFATTDGPSIDLPLFGPFPVRKTTTAVVEVPSNVSRTYFRRAKPNAGEIVGAQF